MNPVIWVAELRYRDYEIRNPDGSVRTTVEILSFPLDKLKLDAALKEKKFVVGDEIVLTIRKKGTQDPYDKIMELIGVT